MTDPLAGAFLGLRTLIVGDAGVGKTALTAAILEALVARTGTEGVVVLDMAPERLGVGLALARFTGVVKRVAYLRPPGLRAPRLEGQSANEVKALAEHNRAIIEPLLERCADLRPRILAVNDLSLYLQAGDPERLLKCIRAAGTFLGNAYYGGRLAEDRGSGVSEREREGVRVLMRTMNRIVTVSLRGFGMSASPVRM